MITIDMSNKHKKRLVAFVELTGGQLVIVGFDTLSKIHTWLSSSFGITSYAVYNESGAEVNLN